MTQSLDFMKTLVMIEVRSGHLPPVSRETVAAARKLGGEVIAVLTEGTDDHARHIFAAGADIVIKNLLPGRDPVVRAKVFLELARTRGADLIFLPHSYQGLDLAGELAIRMGARTFSDVIQVYGDRSSPGFARLVQGGRILLKEKPGFPLIVTIRPNTQDIISYDGPEEIEASEVLPEGGVLRFLEEGKSYTGRPDLRDASFVIGVGAGIGDPDNMVMIEEMADALGAAIGGTRSVVERGWMDEQFLIGTGGKMISPYCYISCGASGSEGHLAGVGSARVIVAINHDPCASVFKRAHYGLVANLTEAIPLLTDRLKKML